MSITFIRNPSFTIDFAQFKPKEAEEVLPVDKKIVKVVSQVFELIKIFYQSVGTALYKTASNAGISFKHIVLGFYGSSSVFYSRFRPESLYLIAFKIVYWAAAMVWCFASTASRLFFERVLANSDSPLAPYAGEFDLRHIKSNEVALDASHVAPEIKVDDLDEIFDKINFTDPQLPGYMAPLSRKEDVKINTVEALKASLKVFVDNVKDRKAFLGTPPSYDTPRLMAFYQQIEDAIRLSIHKSTQDLNAFYEVNGRDVNAYSESQKRQYSNLLEDRSRLAIDMAIAGLHCGARFMGEAMSTYYGFYGASTKDEGSLQENLFELMAHGRKAIALKHIQMKLGNGTHAFNKYMSNMGPLLALPGTKNIIEHLDTSFNRDEYLKLFFKEFTVDYAIGIVQEEIKKSNTFRDKIMGWIRDQLQDWKKPEYAAQEADMVSNIRGILVEEDNVDEHVTHLEIYKELITHLKQKQIELPDVTQFSWDDFLIELFVLDESKQWSKEKFQDLSLPKRLQKIISIRGSLSEKVMDQEMIGQLKEFITAPGAIHDEMFKNRFSMLSKLKKICILTALPDDTIERIIRGKVELEEIVKNKLDHDRRREFIDHFKIENMDSEGISAEIMEWLLVANNILLVQE